MTWMSSRISEEVWGAPADAFGRPVVRGVNIGEDVVRGEELHGEADGGGEWRAVRGEGVGAVVLRRSRLLARQKQMHGQQEQQEQGQEQEQEQNEEQKEKEDEKEQKQQREQLLCNCTMPTHLVPAALAFGVGRRSE